MVLHNWGAGDFKVATSLGKIIRDHGLDVRVGGTIVADCANVTETECLALKRSGKVLDACGARARQNKHTIDVAMRPMWCRSWRASLALAMTSRYRGAA
jgi:hypothetical protein